MKVKLKNNLGITLVKVDKKTDFSAYLHVFSKDVVKKITSYYFTRDQRVSFTAELLKHYYLLGTSTRSDRVIKSNSYGKPYFTPQSGSDRCIFNLSHSRDYVVLVYTQEHGIDLGVDIEYIDQKIDYQNMMPLVFSEFECQQIKNVRDFYKLWTKKEALIKAYGTGFGNDWYQTTSLTLDDVTEYRDYLIYTKELDKSYFLSICILRV